MGLHGKCTTQNDSVVRLGSHTAEGLPCKVIAQAMLQDLVFFCCSKTTLQDNFTDSISHDKLNSEQLKAVNSSLTTQNQRYRDLLKEKDEQLLHYLQ